MKKSIISKALAGLCLTFAGVLFLLGKSGRNIDAEQEIIIVSSSENATTEAPSKREQVNTIFVHVCGAVRTPGVYELPEGSRVTDAVGAAGGFSADADTQSMNLASTLSDGMQVRVPTLTETAQNDLQGAIDASGRVNINAASADELMTLPGIGKSKATAIVAYREKHGRFEKPEDIMKVSGIKQAAFDQIEDYIYTG